MNGNSEQNDFRSLAVAMPGGTVDVNILRQEDPFMTRWLNRRTKAANSVLDEMVELLSTEHDTVRKDAPRACEARSSITRHPNLY